MKLTRNFALSEFKCADGTPVPQDYPMNLNIEKLADNLQVIRDFFNAKVTINSGYRTKAYNAKIGGARHSLHLTASAADIVVEGYTASQVADVIEGLIRVGVVHNGGLGRYKRFTHYDIGARRRWNG
jgi:uncharacterized protein YcbK (DUF882 family)